MAAPAPTQLELRPARRYRLLAALHAACASKRSYLSLLPADMRREHLDVLVCPPSPPTTMRIMQAECMTYYEFVDHGISLHLSKPGINPAWTIMLMLNDGCLDDTQELVMTNDDPLLINGMPRRRWFHDDLKWILHEDWQNSVRVPLAAMLHTVEHLLPLDREEFCFRPVPPGRLLATSWHIADGTMQLLGFTSQ